MPALTFDDLVSEAPVAPAAGMGSPGPLTFDDLAPPSAPEQPSTLKDVAKAAGAGYLRGVAGLVGAPADLARGARYLADNANAWLQGRPYDDVAAEADARALIPRSALARFGGAAMTKRLEDLGTRVSGEDRTLYQPQTTPGKYAERAAEFVPGASLGGGRTALEALVSGLKYGVAPGLASEAAGQATEGTAMEVPARIGAALLAGGGAGYLSRPSPAGQAVAGAMRDLEPAARAQAVQEAAELVRTARDMGVPLSMANAMDRVTGGATNLSNLQRIAEGSGRLKDFYARMPEGVDQAGRATFDTVAPVSTAPSTVGPQVAEAAGQTVQDATDAINATTRPLYQQSDAARVGPQVLDGLMSDPLYAATLREVRGNPALNRTIENLPDDSGAVLDLVQRRMREAGDNAAVPGQASTSNLAASNYQDARQAPIAAVEGATGGAGGAYAQARDVQQQLREQNLAPLTQGPIGRLARLDNETGDATRRAMNVLFPSNPLPNSQREIASAVSNLAQRNPMAARQIVRAHLESTFNEATQNLQGGPNAWGGAGFAAQVRGNPQQAANLDAAMRALPNGDQVADGMNRFLDVLEATGLRQRVGSQTAFNAEELQRLRQAGWGENAIKIASGGGIKLPQKMMDTMERWRLGQNLDQIARLLTDPDALGAFRGLARAGNTSGPAGRLVAIASRAAQDERTGSQSSPGQ